VRKRRRHEGRDGALSIQPFEGSRVTTLWDLNRVSRAGWGGGARERRVGGVAKRGGRGDGSVDGPRSKAMEGLKERWELGEAHEECWR
jgi:hypothetical protein